MEQGAGIMIPQAYGSREQGFYEQCEQEAVSRLISGLDSERREQESPGAGAGAGVPYVQTAMSCSMVLSHILSAGILINSNFPSWQC